MAAAGNEGALAKVPTFAVCGSSADSRRRRCEEIPLIPPV